MFVRFAAEQYGVMSAIPAKPVEVKNYIKHCEQRRKFPVLYKVEFQVSSHLVCNALKKLCLESNEEIVIYFFSCTMCVLLVILKEFYKTHSDFLTCSRLLL